MLESVGTISCHWSVFCTPPAVEFGKPERPRLPSSHRPGHRPPTWGHEHRAGVRVEEGQSRFCGRVGVADAFVKAWGRERGRVGIYENRTRVRIM